MARIILDISGWPVPVVAAEGRVSSEELNSFFDEYSKLLQEKREPYGLVIDLRRSGDMPAKERQALTEFMKRNEPIAGMYNAGTALVFESPLMRVLLTAVFWVKRPPHETRVFETVTEAEAWARENLRRKLEVFARGQASPGME